jgi:hypothetical protein
LAKHNKHHLTRLIGKFVHLSASPLTLLASISHYLTMPTIKTSIAAWFLLLAKVHGQLILAGGRGPVILELFLADRTTKIGPMVNDMVIDLAKTPALNIKASTKSGLQKLRVSSMSFRVDDKLIRTDSTVPSWMLGDPNSAWRPSVGVHTIEVNGYRRNEGKGRKMLHSTFRVIVIDTRTMAPVQAPVKAPEVTPIVAPVAAPVVAPVTAPVPTPAAAPVAAPANPPSKTPVKAPTKTPVLVAPSKILTRAPLQNPVTKAPTRRPTVAPTSAPTPCVSDIVKYINSITLSNQTLSVMGFTALDAALLQLLLLNTKEGVRLSTCNDADRVRLRQRYAYLALVYSMGKGNEASWFDDADECKWSGMECEKGIVTALYFDNRGLEGRIPAEVGLWSSMKDFEVYSNRLIGPLPTSMGLWKNLTYIDIGDNQFNGTIPSFMGLWTNLEDFYVYFNKFTGELPISTMAAWTKLDSIELLQNQFYGPLPPAMGDLWPVIRIINIGRNNFTGALPASVGRWSTLNWFFCHKNQLTGTIPATVKNWTMLARIWFHGNSFTGPVPSFSTVNGKEFCPKNGTGPELSADCQSEITCACCNGCCDNNGDICTGGFVF